MTEPEPPEEAGGDPSEDVLDAEQPELSQSTASECHDTAGAEDHVLLAALVRRIVHQDEAALGDLYRRLATRVFRQASRLVQDIGTAEEVVEDVFWQVWRQAPRFDPARGNVIAWVMQMARSRRQLVSLAFERGYSQSEIAAQMGLPLGTVKSHVRRALATMKTSLEGALVASPENKT